MVGGVGYFGGVVVADFGSERGDQHKRVFDIVVDDVAVGPCALVFERLREVPVEERWERHDVVRQQLVDEAVVVVEPFLIHRALAFGKDARPGNREAV